MPCAKAWVRSDSPELSALACATPEPRSSKRSGPASRFRTSIGGCTESSHTAEPPGEEEEAAVAEADEEEPE